MPETSTFETMLDALTAPQAAEPAPMPGAVDLAAGPGLPVPGTGSAPTPGA